MRKRLYLARSLAASPGPIVTAGAGAAGGTGTTGGTETSEDEVAGRGEEAGRGTVTGEGKRTDGGAVTTGGAATIEGEFKRLSGALCDPSPMAFFGRLDIPFDSSVGCWQSSAISMWVGDKSFVCKRSGLCRPRTEDPTYRKPSIKEAKMDLITFASNCLWFERVLRFDDMPFLHALLMTNTFQLEIHSLPYLHFAGPVITASFDYL